MITTGFPGSGPTLRELGEREVIRLMRAAAPSSLNGDDAAVLTPAAPNSRVVASTDMLVEGRHFAPETSTPYFVGRKAVLQNFADIEAMGARPIAALLAVSADPETPARVLEDLARGQGPDAAVLSLGYAGWGAGQLEAEMLANGWLTAEPSDEILFGADDDLKWNIAVQSLGIDPRMLSSAAGHA